MSDHEQLIRRLDELGTTAVAGTTAPPFDAHALRRGRRRTHRGRWLAGVAAAAVAVVGAAVWAPWMSDTKRVDTVAPTTPRDESFPMLMPDPWPEAYPGDIVTRGPVEPRPDLSVVAEHLLARDGVAAAHAGVADFPAGDGTPDIGRTATADTIDGRDAQWTTGPTGTSLFLALEPGRSLFVLSSTASRDELEALALAYDGDRLEFDADAMPKGWTTQADPAEVATFSDGLPPSSWASVRNDGESTEHTVFVTATRAADPAAVLEQFTGLAGDRAEPVQVSGRAGVTITGVGPHPGGSMVVWVYDERTVAAVTVGGPDPSVAVGIAESVRAVDAATWTSFNQEPGPPPRIVDGFALSGVEVVVDSGEAFGHRWMVTTPASLPNGMHGTSLHLIDPDGYQHSSGWGGSPGSKPVGVGGSGVAGGFRYFHAEIPRDVTEPGIVLHGERRDVVTVDTGGDGLLIFTLVESRSTPIVNPGDVYVSGVLPDGGEYRDPPLPPGP